MAETTGKLALRDTDIITIEDLSREFIRPERLRLKLNSAKRCLDIGSLAYTVRDKRETSKANNTLFIDVDSFMPSRRELIRCILESYTHVRSDRTIISQQTMHNLNLDWCDANNFSGAFSTADETILAYKSYTQYLNHRIALASLNPSSASIMQNSFVKLAQLCFPVELRNIKYAAQPIKFQRRITAPPSDEHVKKYLSVCLKLARNLKAFILNGEKYPYPVQVDDLKIVLFPSINGICTPLSKEISSYNPAEQRISTTDEYLTSRKQCGKTVTHEAANNTLNRVKKNLLKCNENLKCNERMRIASLAMNCYTMILSSLIGTSPTELSQLEFTDALEIEKSPLKKELSAVKFRANGRKTRHSLGRKEGLTILQEYLDLRHWVLDGKTFDKLFFSMTFRGKYKGEFSILPTTFNFDFHKKISGVVLDPSIPRLTASNIRKYKSVMLHSLGLEPNVVADVMNHTKATNLTYYSNATPEQQEREFGKYWRAIRKVAENHRNLEISVGTSIASGHCNSFNNPGRNDDLVAIQPSCRDQYGCLYCQHYVCHSDEEDISKLLSLQYVVFALRKTASDFGHAELLFKDLSIRIEFILNSIGSRSKEINCLVEATKYKVHDLGILTPFWEKRLQRYEQLGIAF